MTTPGDTSPHPGTAWLSCLGCPGLEWVEAQDPSPGDGLALCPMPAPRSSATHRSPGRTTPPHGHARAVPAGALGAVTTGGQHSLPAAPSLAALASQKPRSLDAGRVDSCALKSARETWPGLQAAPALRLRPSRPDPPQALSGVRVGSPLPGKKTGKGHHPAGCPTPGGHAVRGRSAVACRVVVLRMSMTLHPGGRTVLHWASSFCPCGSPVPASVLRPALHPLLCRPQASLEGAPRRPGPPTRCCPCPQLTLLPGPRLCRPALPGPSPPVPQRYPAGQGRLLGPPDCPGWPVCGCWL